MEKHNKTYQAKSEGLARNWWIIDLSGQVLGRAASQIANILRGRHKPIFTPYVDTGDFVVVVNADKVKLTGDKMTDKVYYNHSGYIGGLKETPAKDLLKRRPEDLITRAVKGMIPKNALGKQMLKKLKVYVGESHPHFAQQPKPYQLIS